MLQFRTTTCFRQLERFLSRHTSEYDFSFFYKFKTQNILKPIRPKHFQKKKPIVIRCVRTRLCRRKTIRIMRKRIFVLFRLDVGIPVTYA